MATTTVYDMTKKKVGEIELADSVFAVKVQKGLLHEAVITHLSNARQGTVANKTRRDVRGGGKKPYKQKGTGRARHGSNRSPIFVGGGSTFGPKPRDWRIEMPKKQRHVALRMALSEKYKSGEFFVVNDWVSSTGKTSDMAKTLQKWNAKSELIVTTGSDSKTIRAVRNIPNVKIMRETDLSVYDVMRFENVLVTSTAVRNISERLAG